MSTRNRAILLALFVSLVTIGHAQSSNSQSGNSPVSITVNDRTRVDAWNWFAAPPKNETYGYVESLLRISIAQRIHKWDWSLGIAQPAVLGLPDNAVSPVTAQGQLGLGGTYYASNGNNTEPAAAFFKQGYARYHFDGTDRSLRIGRVEFVEGQETKPENPTVAWVQTNRIANRLAGKLRLLECAAQL